MNTHLSFLIPLLLLHVACTRETVEEPIFLDETDLSILHLDLQPGVRSLTIDIFEATRLGGEVVAGKLLAKADYEFIPLGLCSRVVAYTLLPSGNYHQTSTRDREFDDKMRLTRELLVDYIYRTSPDTLIVVTGETIYTYDDEARTATCLEYKGGSLSRDDYTSVVKKVYPLKENGRLYHGIREEYALTRAITSCRRVVLASDERNNWTEAYIQEENDATSPLVYDYTKRYINYY
ncbi:MAG: intracellular growth attenuator family protein [Odoribacteraceae bacterium]|jgi:hypothetical protein|nr:intracellular growth attenuator family protein [Odoribacteraceae bacterium]